MVGPITSQDAGLSLCLMLQVAGAVSDALREPVATYTPTLTPTPAAGFSLASLGSIGGATASALSALGSTPATQSADPSFTPASPAGLGGVLSSLGLSVPTQTPVPSGLAGALANIGSAGTTLQRGINDISTIESLLDPAAPAVQAPSPGPSMAPAPSPVQALASAPPSDAPTPAPYSSLPPSSAPAPAPGSALPSGAAPAPAPVSMSPSLAPQSSQDPGTAAAVALAQAGSNADATVADLLSQINDAVASLNSSTAGAVQSLTGAIARYNAAALALEATGGFVNATERLEDALTAATNHGLQDLQSVLNTTGATAAVIAQGGMAALSGISAAASQGLQVIESLT